MARNYTPGPKGDFYIWQSNFVTHVTALLPNLGLAASDLPRATIQRCTLAPVSPALRAAHAARQARANGRAGSKGTIHRPVCRLQTSPNGGKTAHFMPRSASTTGELGL